MYTSRETTLRYIIYSKKQEGRLWDSRCPFTCVLLFWSNCSSFHKLGVIYYFFMPFMLTFPFLMFRGRKKAINVYKTKLPTVSLQQNSLFPSDVPPSDKNFKILFTVPILCFSSSIFFLWLLGEIFVIFLLLLCHHESKPTCKFSWSNVTLSKLLLESSYTHLGEWNYRVLCWVSMDLSILQGQKTQPAF